MFLGKFQFSQFTPDVRQGSSTVLMLIKTLLNRCYLLNLWNSKINGWGSIVQLSSCMSGLFKKKKNSSLEQSRRSALEEKD